MNRGMLLSLSGDWTVERSGLQNSWVGLKYARFDISSGKEESRQASLEEWSLFLAQLVKSSAWWFRQRPLSSIYSVQWSCCQSIATESGAQWQVKLLYCRCVAWTSTQLYIIQFIQDEQQDFFLSVWIFKLLLWIRFACQDRRSQSCNSCLKSELKSVFISSVNVDGKFLIWIILPLTLPTYSAVSHLSFPK